MPFLRVVVGGLGREGSASAEEAFPEGGGFVVAALQLVEVTLVGPVVVHHLVDGSPVGEAAHAEVVDIEVCLHLAAGGGGVFLGFFLREVGIDGVELHPAASAVVHRLVQQVALAHRPQDELVVLFLQLAERGEGEGYLLAYLGVFVLHDCAVEIYCDYHVLLCCFAMKVPRRARGVTRPMPWHPDGCAGTRCWGWRSARASRGRGRSFSR